MISIQVEDKQMNRGRTIADKVLRLLENYRGTMGDLDDVFNTTTPIRVMDGYGGSYRYIFNVFVNHKELTTYPI